MTDLPKLSDVKVVPITDPINMTYHMSMLTSSGFLKQKKQELDKLLIEFMDELSRMVKRKIGNDLQLDCHVDFVDEGFSKAVFITMYTPNNEMSYKSLIKYVHSLNESSEFKDMNLIFYFSGIDQIKENE